MKTMFKQALLSISALAAFSLSVAAEMTGAGATFVYPAMSRWSADYNAATDHTAEYGIAGLIAGAAGLKVAAKVGIFALLAKKFAIFWKFILIGILAVGGGIKKLFGRKEAA